MMIMGHLPELLGLLAIGLIFFGPKRLPEIGHSLGKGIRDFKKGVSDMDLPGTDHILHTNHEQPVATTQQPAAVPATVHESHTTS